MIIFRRVVESDFEAYVTLALASHINFYSLPKNRHLLENIFKRALHSFTDSKPEPDRQFYLFVAEDSESKKMLGISAITATSGGNEPLYFFRREYQHVDSLLEPVVKKLELLNPISYAHGPSEVCSLFVDPASRGMHVGKLLSTARFLFAARFAERFTGSFIAELRGVLHNDTSLFWDSIGRHFFDRSFLEMQEMMPYGRSFIGQFLPKYPIYISLLPKEVQEIIGKVDRETEGALHLLARFGFHQSHDVDVIDGGPKLVAKREAILPIAHSKKVIIDKLESAISSDAIYLLANDRLDFRACFAAIHPLKAKSIAIDSDTASALEIGVGDSVRILDLRGPKS